MTRASKRAIRTNKALGLDTVIVKNNRIVRVDPDGNEHIVKELEQNGSSEPAKPVSLK